MHKKISAADGNTLLALARSSIGQRLGRTKPPSHRCRKGTVFAQQSASFVTLTLNNQLRGCIGNVVPSESLQESVIQNALKAAFHDHRFSPLEKEAFDQVAISISVLGKPNQVAYTDPSALPGLLTPGIDGVILEHGGAKATFLPHVWRHLPDPVRFLSQLCLKAGLGPACWKTEQPDIFIYQVQWFSE